MIRLVLIFLLLASPALAQVRKNTGARSDTCAPIGRTADGQLVYAMTCNNLPTPAPQARRTEEPVSAEPEVERSGIFGLSYSRKPAPQ